MTSTAPSHQPNPTLFFDTLQGYQRAYALKAAVDLDLFTAIASGNATAAEIARTCRASERGVRILADYLTVAGFLVKSGERYSVTPDTAVFLDGRRQPTWGGRWAFYCIRSRLSRSSIWPRRFARAKALRTRWRRTILSGWILPKAWRR